MIPLRDSPRSRTFPIVNIALIIINFVIFIRQLGLTPQAVNQIFYQYGLIPARVQSDLAAGASWMTIGIPFITAIFLHSNWLHILGNMLYLWIFGDNVEDRLGHIPYLLFYLVAGIAGNCAHVLANSGSQVPIIGASGAIAGVLGGYFLTYPKAKVLTLVPIFFFITAINVPAFLFLPFWFVMQIVSGLSSAGTAASTVAWWAHIGGFVAGAVLIKLMPPQKNRLRPY
jgi:membrane associated rhomboid family serine protease